MRSVILPLVLLAAASAANAHPKLVAATPAPNATAAVRA